MDFSTPYFNPVSHQTGLKVDPIVGLKQQGIHIWAVELTAEQTVRRMAAHAR